MVYKLSDICTITKGSLGIMKAIPGNYSMITLGEENTTHNDFQFDAKAVIVPLISSTGHGHASMKRVKYYEGKFALGNILCAVIPKDESVVNAKFLHIYLHENKDKLLVPLMKGTANVSLSIANLNNVEVIIPSIKRQLEIVELEKIISYKNIQLSNLYNEQNILIPHFRQKIIQDAIQGKLTADWRKENLNTEPVTELLKRIKVEKEQLLKARKIKNEKPLPPIAKEEIPFDLPKEWIWCYGSDIFKPMESKLPTSKTFGYIDIASIDNKKHKLIEPRYIPVEEAPSRASRKIFKGSTLFSLVRPYLGNIAFIDEKYSDCIASTGFFVCTPFNGIYPKYLYCLMISSYVIQGLNNLMKGVNSPSINTDDILTFKYPIPPLPEQKVIVEKVDILLEKCSNLQTEIKNQNKYSKDLLKALFNETFGEINTKSSLKE